MAISNFVKRIQDVMRNDSGVNGDAQRIEQIVWILFLKIYDAKEEAWELYDDNYKSIIPEGLKWRDWAVDLKDGEALTGDALLDFVNNKLFPTLKNLEIDEETPMSQIIVKSAFEDANNYQKDGVLLRQVINIIDEIDFTEYKERHEFGAIYESFLKDLQSAGNAGEFYTPRAVTDFMVEVVKPVLGEKVADFACGTGGFLTSALNALDKQVGNSLENREIYNKSVYGIEKKSLPHMLSVTNMLIHDIDDPDILHGNALETDYKELRKMEHFDVILMNPPYGGSEKESVKVNFPMELRSSETADLFMNVIMYRLKKNGRAAVILPDGFLFGTDNAKFTIKKKLFSEFNVHTVIRMPHSVFAPYTSIRTNILFFDNTKPTEETWFYRVDMPEGYKNFSKTRPMKLEHFNEALAWWENREDIEVDGYPKAKKYTINEIVDRSYNIDLCGFPHVEEVILEPMDLIQEYQEKRASLNAEIDHVLEQITSKLGGN
ncbi:type I restriction-modification system subunit M [Bacillus paralicheniformis]|jgi:type I restriction enzyme M protein|uniref:site-specific DNA-methyltransferase (adenine-specific) n=1 Tax=Bacillus paralicheniformis TaxID=1648923 RepID=A0AAW6KGM2_9BACI|nr:MULTISPECIES: class I SAM-dependent DNA methyltransferase [Bacillus]KJD54782.1 restriction endonuclease subunit M [Bacillus amyloliquefaciens]KUL08794.1 type I restriction endonuclease subunit M [Bacillus licheniformis LMG 7559]MBC8624133.1 SAM-dependent DNA methyltransferase [Robertmurraya crescens]AGN35407.1 type I restriction-modification system modification subunit HsdM [Bacillus paralicheniformis ATCC 9945a]ARA84837.1 SAM-dependent methyltransferase [Bacillus paralicheniformis]